MSAEMAQTDDDREPLEYGYTFSADGREVITFETRHDAIGFAAMWERSFEGEVNVEAHRRTDVVYELATLR